MDYKKKNFIYSLLYLGVDLFNNGKGRRQISTFRNLMNVAEYIKSTKKK